MYWSKTAEDEVGLPKGAQMSLPRGCYADQHWHQTDHHRSSTRAHLMSLPFGRVISHLTGCPRDLALDVTHALQRKMNLDNGMQQQLVAEAVRRAKEATGQKMQSVTVRSTVVHCMATPWLRTGPWVFRDEAPASTYKSTIVSGGLAPNVDSSGTSAHELRPQTPEL